ncbi:hypothetical protein ACQR0Z_25255 [Bradyrhizobium sp. HKCCYLS3077]|uniref:hypothetical protein n=1 Tax=Bradyrhizobium sp. HKCCYLS3077 TaxID=3420761 RepID=UPI003EBF15EE
MSFEAHLLFSGIRHRKPARTSRDLSEPEPMSEAKGRLRISTDKSTQVLVYRYDKNTSTTDHDGRNYTHIVIPWRAQREPGIHNHERELVEDFRHSHLAPHDQMWLWIPGSRYARPGMTAAYMRTAS